MTSKKIQMKIAQEDVRINELETMKEIVDQKLPKQSCILFVGEIRAAGFKRKFFASSGFDLSVAEAWMEKTKTPHRFYLYLKNKGVTHLLVVASGVDKNYMSRIEFFLNQYCKPTAFVGDKILLAEIVP